MDRREEKRVRLSPELIKLVDLAIKAQFEENVNFGKNKIIINFCNFCKFCF